MNTGGSCDKFWCLSFFWLPDLSCNLEDAGIGVFWWHCAAWEWGETKHGSSSQDASQSTSKNTGVVLVPYPWKCIPKAIFGGADNTLVVNYYNTKITSRIGVSRTPSLLFGFWPLVWLIEMAILLTGQQSDNFESLDSLKLSLTNIWGLCSKIVSFDPSLKPNSPDILALCGANVDDSIGSGNFSFKGYLPLIWKDSVTHMHVLAVYVRKDFLLCKTYL